MTGPQPHMPTEERDYLHRGHLTPDIQHRDIYPLDHVAAATGLGSTESDIDDQDVRNGLHWKTRALVEWAAGRPFAWVDDEITDTDRAWVAAHHQGHALLHRVDPRYGLTDRDYAALDSWPRQLV